LDDEAKPTKIVTFPMKKFGDAVGVMMMEGERKGEREGERVGESVGVCVVG
jgi:hypothetical protein